MQLISILGIFAFLAMAWGMSSDRRRFPWRTVLSGLGLQVVIAVLILRTDLGKGLFTAAQALFSVLTDASLAGAAMVFGPLSDKELLAQSWGPENTFIFVVTVTSIIIVVSSISSLLYHYGVLQRLVQCAAWLMHRLMRTSGSESLAAAANILMGQTEAPLLVKPYLPRMTRSELMALMVGGMSTVAGSVLALYVLFGEQSGRADMAGHLMTASIISAPAGLMMAKILLPETAESETRSGQSTAVKRTTINGLDAVCQGASDGMRLALNVMAMLIAFIAAVKLINIVLALPQNALFSMMSREGTPVTLEQLFGWLNAPFAWLMGVSASDCVLVGQVLGERVVTNEMVGYLSLSEMNKAGELDQRSFTLATYALCGFANFGSVAVQIGGISALAPERRTDLVQLGLRAMVGGLLACYLTAALVGIIL